MAVTNPKAKLADIVMAIMEGHEPSETELRAVLATLELQPKTGVVIVGTSRWPDLKNLIVGATLKWLINSQAGSPTTVQIQAVLLAEATFLEAM